MRESRAGCQRGVSSSRRSFLRRALGASSLGALWASTELAQEVGASLEQQSPVATDSDWPMFQHDAWNSGTLDTDAPSEPVEAAWTFETDDGLVAQPVIKDGTVFQVSRDSNVYAISADSGEEEWSVGTNSSLTQTPAVADNIVYVPTQTGRVLALSVGTGSGQWSASLGFDVSSDLTLTSDSILLSEASDSADYVYALNRATGETTWQYEIESEREFNTPVVADGRIHVQYTGTTGVQTRTLSDRTVVWSEYVGGDSGQNPETASPGISYSDYDGGVVFAADDDSGETAGVASLDAATGEQNWKVTDIGEVGTTPTLADGTLYVTTRAPALYAVDPSIGTERWSVELDGNPTSPVVADGTVYLGTAAGTVHAFDAESSEQRWVFETGSDIVAPPAVLDGTVYAASTDGTLYALREKGSVSPGDVTGNGDPARDLDDDGLYEDVNGDGAFTILDVQALFANLESDAVQDNPEKFDFNGDGEVDVTDVQALYARLNE